MEDLLLQNFVLLQSFAIQDNSIPNIFIKICKFIRISFKRRNQLNIMEKIKINVNLSDLFNPGLYKITCTINQKVYIGESSNLFSRLGRHTDNLENNPHDCFELQRDFNQYPKNNFIIEALEIDSKYQDKKLRKQRETFLILQIPEEFRYNKLKLPKPSRSKGIRIKDKIYSSLSNAAKVLNEGRTNIVRKALNPKNLDYVFLTYEENLALDLDQEYQFRQSCLCVIDGTVYDSLNQAAKDKKIHHKTVKNRILSNKWPNYNFFNENNRSKDYPSEE